MCLPMFNFLQFGELQMRFLNIAPFGYSRYVVKNLGLLEILFVLQCELYRKPAFS